MLANKMVVLSLIMLAGIAGAVRHVETWNGINDPDPFPDLPHADSSIDDCPVCAFRHFRELAAQASDLESWRAAVEKNALAGDHSSSFLEAEAISASNAVVDQDSASRPAWPKRWEGKLKPDAIPVGQGAFGTVYVATVACDDSKVAVKAMKTKKAEADEEADLLKLFSNGSKASPNFLTYFQHGQGQDKLWYIMMEAALGNTLQKIVGGQSQSSSNDKMQLFLDMVAGVAHMHKSHIVHRDLKPANVMISRSCGLPDGEQCHAKVGDLGLSCWTGEGSKIGAVPKCRGIGGTPIYIAPETYALGLVHEKNDVWALGLMLYELLFKKLPQVIEMSSSLKQLETNIKKFDISKDPKFNAMKPGLEKDLLAGMLQNSYKSRLDAASALKLAQALVPSPDEDEQGELAECFDEDESVAALAAAPSAPAVKPLQKVASEPVLKPTVKPPAVSPGVRPVVAEPIVKPALRPAAAKPAQTPAKSPVVKLAAPKAAVAKPQSPYAAPLVKPAYAAGKVPVVKGPGGKKRRAKQSAVDIAKIDSEDIHVKYFKIENVKYDVSSSFLFNPELVDPKTGLVKPAYAQNAKFVRAPVQPGDVILEVNDKSWRNLDDLQRDQLKEGLFGALVFKYRKATPR